MRASCFVFNAMSPLQQEEYSWKKPQAPKTSEEAKFLADLKSAHETTKAQLKTDSMTAGVCAGLFHHQHR